MKKAIALFLSALMVIQGLALNQLVLASSAVDYLERHILADWDTPDRSPAPPDGARVGIPYEGYKFGNSLLTGMKTLALTPNTEAAGDKMLAMYIKDSEPVTPSVAHWTSFLFYSSDYNRPQGLEVGMPIYYIPSTNNDVDMSIYTSVSNGLYSKNTENNDVRLDYGYEGWIMIDLSRVTVDWWNGKVSMESVAAEKIIAMDIVAGLSDGTVIDEIQTFNGTPEEFKEICGEKTEEGVFKRSMLADWDDQSKSPEVPAGAEVKVPYSGYPFGNALITGMKTLALTPNPEAAGDKMLAMYIKDSESVSPGNAHWTTFLFYSSDYNRPQGMGAGLPIYYIPSADNGVDMSIYTPVSDGLYSKNTENNEVRFDYGYEGWIIIDLNNVTLDWWNGKVSMKSVAAEKITAMDIVAGLSDGTVIDEIQTFNGTPEEFKAVCDRKPTDKDPEDCGHVSLQHIEAKEPTCAEPGNVEYWYCVVCNSYFKDENAEEAVDSIFVPTVEHVYENGVCKWCAKTEPKPDPVVAAGMGHLLVDWDTALPIVANGDTISAVSGYGNALQFDNAQLNIYPDLASGYGFKAGDNALAFYMIIPKGVSQTFHFMVLEQSGEGYQLANEVDYMLIDQNGKVTKESYINQTVTLPGGYAGWVVLPLSSLEIHPSYPTVDGVLTAEEINNIQYFAFDGSGPYYFDQYYALDIADIDGFAAVCNTNREEVGEPPQPEKPPTELDPSDDENRNGIFCNFDDVDMISVQASAKYEVISGNGFDGNYLSFTSENAQTLLTPLQVNFNAQGRTFDTAMVMRFASFSQLNSDFYFAVHDTLKPGKTELYQFKPKTVIYTIDNDGHFDSKTVNNQTVNIEAGFNGWLIIPFSALERHTSWPKYNEVLNIENITAIQFWSGNAVGTFGLDDIRTVPDLYAFAGEYGDYVPPVPNNVTVNDFEEGNIVQDKAEGEWSAYCRVDEAELSADTDINMGGTIALRIDAKKNAGVRIRSFLTEAERNSAASYGHMGAYIDNLSGKELNFIVDIKTAGDTVKLKPTSYTKDYYLLSDGNTGNTKAYPLTGNGFIVPADFSGYIIWNLTSYEKAADIASLEEVIFNIPAGNSIIADNISVINDVDAYISAALNSNLDSDYILPNNSSVKVSDDSITLENAAVSSTVFRNNVSVRRGFYLVFNDGDGNQVFGVQKSLANIKNINVFQSGKLMKSYSVTNYVKKGDGVEEIPDVPDVPKPVLPDDKPVAETKHAPLKDAVTGIEVGYYSGAAFGKDTVLTVKPLPNKDLPTDVYKYLKTKRYIPYEISLTANGGAVELDDVICIRIPVSEMFDKDKAMVYRVTEDGWLEDMQAVLEGDSLVIYADVTGTYILLQDAETDIGNKAGIYGIDVDEGMEEDDGGLKRVKHTGVRKVKGNYTVWIIIAVAAVVLAGGTVVAVLIVRKRKSPKTGTKGAE